jgi:hypothetical protein
MPPCTPLPLKNNVDNQLHFPAFTPTFALYPQISPSLEPFRTLKGRFRPQPVDKYVDNEFMAFSRDVGRGYG